MTDNTFVTVAQVGDLEPGQMMYVEVGDEPVCLINLDGEYHAINDICTHQEASLSEGSIDGDEIECPLHGGAFNIRTGEPVAFPVVTPVETYTVRVVGDDVQVATNI
ncbi:MAG TPA: non-heme iron oxygenase ferredoxin subunit [Thermomicrobiales bacterium]|nr:non-heme iron oxygenase ferredoxin subunit [Thermomicrobiales bacterium]